MRKKRETEVAQLAAWIDAGLRTRVKDHCRGSTPKVTQRAFLEEAIRRELERRAAPA